MKKIAFATGNIYRWAKDRGELVSLAKQFDFDGIELTFGNLQELETFKLKPEDLDFIKSLDYISIHSPFRTNFGVEKKCPTIIQLKQLYDQVNGHHIVFHSPNVKDFHQIINSKINASIENLTERCNLPNEKFKKILDQHPELGVTLDINHAMVKSAEELKLLINMFKDKIQQIHCSAYINGKEHQPLHLAGEEYLDNIEIVRKLNVPLVLEGDFLENTHDLIKKELEFLKNWY